MPIKAVIFDFDNTLVDTLPIHYEAYRRVSTIALRRHLMGKIRPRFRQWLLSPASTRWDVGYRVYRQFGRREAYQSICLTPVWEHPLYAETTSFGSALAQQLTMGFVSDYLSRFPKLRTVNQLTSAFSRYRFFANDQVIRFTVLRDYATCVTFRSFGLPDLVGKGIEEYLWQGEPFAFHLSGVKRASQGRTGTNGKQGQSASLDELIQYMYARSR